MPATRQLMKRETASFQLGNITDKTDVVEKFDTHRCMLLENHTKHPHPPPPHTHITKISPLPQNLWKKNNGKIAPLYAMKGYGGMEVHSTLS